MESFDRHEENLSDGASPSLLNATDPGPVPETVPTVVNQVHVVCIEHAKSNRSVPNIDVPFPLPLDLTDPDNELDWPKSGDHVGSPYPEIWYFWLLSFGGFCSILSLIWPKPLYAILWFACGLFIIRMTWTYRPRKR